MGKLSRARALESRIRRIQQDIAVVTKQTERCIAVSDLSGYQRWNRKGRKLGVKEDRLRKRLNRLLDS